jgi:hypothetical protein
MKARKRSLASLPSSIVPGARPLAPLLAVVLSACVHVKPYERAQLAHPTRTTSDLARSAEDHVRGIQEGATGGGFAAGGGCGCN